jgi:UDP-glucose 4-epimerase
MLNTIEPAAFRGKHLLVTGGAGMLGSRIASMALEFGATVTVLDAMLPLYGGNLANLPLDDPNLKMVVGDIRDAQLMVKLVAPADYIFSLAAQVSYVDADQAPLMDMDTNCRGHLVLLDACCQAKVRPKIIFASSRFVYGRIEYSPVDELHPFNCLSMYGIHKLTAEKYYRFYQAMHEIPSVSLRIANPYGPRQQMKHGKYGILNWFIRLALEGRPLTIYGDGDQVRDYVYVDDMASAFLQVAAAPNTAGEVYNVGSGIGSQFREMVQLVAREIPGTKVVSIPWPADRAMVETGGYISNLAKLQTATGWKAQIPLPEGIARTVEFYREHRARYW